MSQGRVFYINLKTFIKNNKNLRLTIFIHAILDTKTIGIEFNVSKLFLGIKIK
jgi:hypothetical protein